VAISFITQTRDGHTGMYVQ